MGSITLPNGTELPTYSERLASLPGQPEVHRERLVKYTSFGCYPVFYLDGNDCVLCRDCAQESVDEYEEGYWEKDLPVTFGVNWEDPHMHCECGERIESAYAEEES